MDDDAFAALGLFFLGLGVFLIGAALLIIVWFIVSAIIGYIQYREYMREAQQEFDEMAREVGADLPVDDTLRAYGIDVAEMGEIEDIADLLAYGTVLGAAAE